MLKIMIKVRQTDRQTDWPSAMWQSSHIQGEEGHVGRKRLDVGLESS
jgi:hypothetical protein